MSIDLEQLEKAIVKQHSFGFTPKYEEEIHTSLSKSFFTPAVVKAVEKLGWELVHQDETTVEAKRKGDWDRWTEKITISYNYGKVKVKSVSLGSEMWDNGRNSKRVKLFLQVLVQIEKELTQESLEELARETKRRIEWDDYQVPDNLPKPVISGKPNPNILIAGSIIMSILLGYTLAFISFKFTYVIFLFELGTALLIAFTYQYLIRFSNYTDFEKINYILIGSCILIFIVNQYILYKLILYNYNFEDIGFFEFIKYRLRQGLSIKSLNLGGIGLMISWILQIGLTWLISYFKIAFSLTKYLMDRIPKEVSDFAYYHFVLLKVKRKTKSELS